MPNIYQPEEDSYLLSEILRKLKINKNSRVLDMGAGTGIQTQTLVYLGIKKENILCADINKEAVDYCKKLGFNSIKSNLFENIKDKFDIIIFNPPYLPRDKNEPKFSQLATTGGKKGSEIINKFLRQSKNNLNPEGKIILLTSSLTKNINWNNYSKKLLAKRKLFFEELYVWELRPRE